MMTIIFCRRCIPLFFGMSNFFNEYRNYCTLHTVISQIILQDMHRQAHVTQMMVVFLGMLFMSCHIIFVSRTYNSIFSKSAIIP